MSGIFKKIKYGLGIDNSVSHAEKLASALGGFTGIVMITWVSFHFTGASGSALIVPSMGASAVLVFAVPHGELFQPWALFGGQIISAFVGVACFQLVPDLFLAGGLAVGLAIGMMHVFPWRRYPISMMRFADIPAISEGKSSRYIEKKYIERALSDIDLVVDVNVDNLQQIFALARRNTRIFIRANLTGALLHQQQTWW